MGAQLESLQATSFKSYESLLNMSIEKIKKLHGVFKNICDSFVISLTNYSQIFGEAEKTFTAWDTDNASQIDALEVFTGLIIFSDARTEDKLRLVFELFDFNEIGSIGFCDLQYLIECSISSALKLKGVHPSSLTDFDSAVFLQANFDVEARINFQQFFKFCALSNDIQKFFSLLNISEVDRKAIQRFDKSKPDNPESILSVNIFSWTSPTMLLNRKRYINLREKISLLTKGSLMKLAESMTSGLIEVYLSLQFVYGISMKTSPPIQYLNRAAKATIPGESAAKILIYSCGAAIILYNTDSQQQKYYLEHRHSIECITLSRDHQLAASVEINGTTSKAVIHIWNTTTLNNLAVINATHRGSIQAMAFTCKDDFLVTIGNVKPYALIVYYWKGESKVANSSVIIDTPIAIQQLKYTENDNAVAIITRNKIIEMSIANSMCRYEEYCALSKVNKDFKEEYLTVGGLFQSSPNMPKLILKKVFLFGLTGHSDGTLCYWKNGKEPLIIANYPHSIVSIKQLLCGIAISTAGGHIYIWDIPDTCLQLIDLSSIDTKLSTIEIFSTDNIGDNLIIATKGDILQIELGKGMTKMTIERCNKIHANAGIQNAITTIDISEDNVYIGVGGENGVVQIYDSKQFLPIDTWNIGYSVTALHSVNALNIGCSIAAGTSNGKIFIMNYYDMEEYKYDCAEGKIYDIKISPDGINLAVVSENHYIYLYILDKNKFVPAGEKKIENAYPISVTFSSNSQYIIANTNRRRTIMMDLKSQNVDTMSEDVQKVNWMNWNGRFSLHSKKSTAFMAPFSVAHAHPFLITADECGNFYLYKYNEDLQTIIPCYYHVHASPMSKLMLSKDDSLFFSLSSFDAMLCQWKVNCNYCEGSQAMIQEMTEVETHYMNGIEKMLEVVNRELSYCYEPRGGSYLGGKGQDGNAEEILDKNVLIKGIKNKNLSDCWNIEEEELSLMRRPPSGMLNLERVFGIQTGQRRQSLKYFHDHTQNKDQLQIQNQEDEEVKSKSSMKTPLMQKTTCEKNLLYYVSRFIVLEDPVKNVQKIYEGHTNKVTACIIHPNGKIIASADTSSHGCANIHIWDPMTREYIVKLRTAHETGVSIIDFSSDGDLLLSLGSGKQSLQIFNWAQEREIAFRHLNRGTIFDIKFDPKNRNHIVAIGYECIMEINMCNSSISVTNIVPITELTHKKTFLTMDFLEYPIAAVSNIDVVIGSSTGEVGILSNGNFVLLPGVTHEGPVNIVKVYHEILYKPFCIATAGGDNCIKIWSSKLTCLTEINIPSIAIYKELATQEGERLEFGGIQSLDLYSCTQTENPSFLIGLRNGDVLEAEIEGGEESDKPEAMKALIDATLIMRSHSSQGYKEDQRKLCIAMHPSKSVFASAGYDGTIRFWDITENTLLKRIELGKKNCVSALAFSPKNELLAVGCTSGVVLFYAYRDRILGEEGAEAPGGNSVSEEVVLDFKYSIRDSRGAAILIKFSADGDYMAISYDSELVPQTNQVGKSINVKHGVSFVQLYVHKLNKRNPSAAVKPKEEYVAFKTITFPSVRIQEPRSEGDDTLLKDQAFTHIEFSDDNKYMQLCYMPVSPNGKIDYSSEPQHILWDLYRFEILEETAENLQDVQKVNWSNYSVAPTVYARAVGSQLLSHSPEEEADLLDEEKIILSSLCVFGKKFNDLVIAGSFNGDLHLFSYENLLLKSPQVENQILSDIPQEENKEVSARGINKSHMQAPKDTPEVEPANNNLLLPVDKRTMGISRSYSCASSYVDYIDAKRIKETDYVIASSISDEAIIKYTLTYLDRAWDLDFLSLAASETLKEDPYNEMPTQDRFSAIVNELYIPRSRIFELSEKLSSASAPCEIKPQWVFGRRACDRRNNLFFDYLKRVVYYTGTMIVILKEDKIIKPEAGVEEMPSVELFTSEDKSKTTTEFLEKKPNPSPPIHTEAVPGRSACMQKLLPCTRNTAAFSSPEISCMAMSKNKQIIAVGTSEANAHLYLWDIANDSELSAVFLPNITSVLNVCIHSNNRILACVGYTTEFQQAVILVDSEASSSKQVIAMSILLHSYQYKIRDIEFFMRSQDRVVTAGIQYLGFWKQTGKFLEHRCGDLYIDKVRKLTAMLPTSAEDEGEFGKGGSSRGHPIAYGAGLVCNPEDLQQPQGEDKDTEISFVTFMKIGFLLDEDVMITVGDDGCIYLWNDEKILKKKKAHSMKILCMDIVQSEKLVVTGGEEGCAMIWMYVDAIESLKRDLVLKTTYQIPILFATVCTNVSMAGSSNQYARLPNALAIQSVSIYKNSLLIGVKTGTVYTVDIGDSQGKVKQQKLVSDERAFKPWIHAMDDEPLACIANDTKKKRILCLSKNGLMEVFCIDTKLMLYAKHFSRESQYIHYFKDTGGVLIAFDSEVVMLTDNYDLIESFSLKKNKITAIKVSNDDQRVAIAAVSSKGPELGIYDIEKQFHEFYSIKGFKSKIIAIDFTFDDKFMLCEDEIANAYIYDKATLQQIKEKKQGWSSVGLKIDGHFEMIDQFYSGVNRITSIRKLNEKNIVAVGDCLGSLRLYRYPLKFGDSYFLCRCEHLNGIQDIIINEEATMMMTFAKADRNIIKWNVTYKSEALNDND